MSWILSRLQEPSTWRGLVWLLTAAGMTVSPELAAGIVAAGMAVAGLIGVVMKERASNVEIVLPPVDLVARSERSPPVFVPTTAAVPAFRPPETDSKPGNGSGWNG